MRPRVCWFLSVTLLAGCGGEDKAPEAHNAQLGPHSGPIVPLPGDRGFAEVIVESVPGKKAGLDARVSAFFLQADKQTPLAETPSDVAVTIQLPGDERVELPLSAETDPKDPKASRYTSKVGPYSTDQLMGELTGKIGGESFTLPFATAR